MKSSPNLPASSRMQSPSKGGAMTSKGKMPMKKGSTTSKVMTAAKGKGMKKGY